MNKKRMISLFFLVTALFAVAGGFSDAVLSNFFREAYNADGELRGLIEFPRELPGIMCLFLISSISFMGNYKMGMISQLLVSISMLVLAFTTPEFPVMLVFLFMFSSGIHLFMPIQDAIAFSVFQHEKNIGERMGQYKSWMNVFALLAAICVFVGFKSGFFNFSENPKIIFIVAAIFAGFTFVVLFIMQKESKVLPIKKEKFKLLFRKEYKYYYALSVLFGTQKQIMIVFGPWVFIELLNQKADTIALLTIISSFVSAFFLKALGKWIDKFGIRKIMYADAFSFIGVYIVYGILAAMIVNDKFESVTVAVVLTGALFVADRISTNIGVVRNIYLHSIAVDKSEITKTLSTGMGLDHIVTIFFAPLAGYIWTNIGPQYIFFFAAFLSLFNIVIAKKADIK